ncbi:alpha/beta fold hydrolase [Streptomyces sp. NRRL F-2580]|uniref:alpha/beta fold hydrolase n=1 Tax=Streptomyces sp. NRRL F-2580 TaxID=1463841 RepID=UPI000689B376|nr:alpha/beta hydrolase [Streptomyces sp. NRRL F-2580]
MLAVPGATLHFQSQGSGPVLLLSQSGEGDAERTAGLVPLLADAFTVVTYDRRGRSRSTLDSPARPVTMADHADDVARLLAEVTGGPALMAGFSTGAAIGLQAAVRHHRGLLRTLIAHEPVMPGLLPEAECAEHAGELTAIQAPYAAGGLTAALPAITAHLGIDAAPDETGHRPHHPPHRPHVPQRTGTGRPDWAPSPSSSPAAATATRPSPGQPHSS